MGCEGNIEEDTVFLFHMHYLYAWPHWFFNLTEQIHSFFCKCIGRRLLWHRYLFCFFLFQVSGVLVLQSHSHLPGTSSFYSSRIFFFQVGSGRNKMRQRDCTFFFWGLTHFCLLFNWAYARDKVWWSKLAGWMFKDNNWKHKRGGGSGFNFRLPEIISHCCGMHGKREEDNNQQKENSLMQSGKK